MRRLQKQIPAPRPRHRAVPSTSAGRRRYRTVGTTHSATAAVAFGFLSLKRYARSILDALRSLGDDPSQYDASRLRAFVLERAPRYGRSRAKLLVTVLRVFIRYLIAQDRCPVGLDAAIPIIAGWKLASLPRYLSAADVECVLASCDSTTAIGARDRAVLLLLCRLGLRAGDVAHLHWRDIDWHQATVEVVGKSQRATRLPLSQEVGEALLHHLTNAPGAAPSDPIFLH
jgi:integrase/recombinase XerD